jgi:hypothetical protein
MKMSDLEGSMSEDTNLNIYEIILLKKEEFVEDVVDKEREKIMNLLEEEDMPWKNARRLKSC